MIAVWLWTLVALAGFPVRSVSYEVDVDGPLAELRIEQEFVNDSDVPVEAVYVFPLHEQAAVDGMWMDIDGRVIEGEVWERSAAVREYDRALQAGQAVALTTQERANVFTQRIGNIRPGAVLKVRLRVVQPVPHVDGAYELTLPLVVAPRFVSTKDLYAVPLDAPVGDPADAPDPNLMADIEVAVDSALPLRTFGCSTHTLSITGEGDHHRAASGRVRTTRDLVLRWSVGDERPRVGVTVQSGHALVTLEPPDAPTRGHIVPRELIFVIDESNSMAGEPLEIAQAAVHRALEGLDADDSFRILRFARSVRGPRESRTATPAVLADGHEVVAQLRAGGSTYLLDALREALRTPRDSEGRQRYIVLVSDGLIWADRPVLAAVAEELGGARVFSLGIGPAPNRALLDELARVGGGRTFWMGSTGSVDETVDHFLDAISLPVLSDIQVDWGDWQVEGQAPYTVPDLFVGQPGLVTARVVRQGSSPVRVRGRLGDGGFDVRVRPVLAEDGRSIPSTWARQRIGRLDGSQLWGDDPEVVRAILDLSLEYQVLSAYTAFIAVDRAEVVAQEEPEPAREPEEPEEPAEEDEPARSRNRWTGDEDDDYDDYDDYGGVEEIVVMSSADAVEVENTSRGVVITKEFLERVPAGRSYQNAVQMAAGVSGGGNPNMAGGASNENTYLLDGANVTDPVTGTFSANFNFDAIQQIEVVAGGAMPEHIGITGTLVSVTTISGSNNLETQLRVDHALGVSGAELGSTTVGGRLSGPVVRDRVWLFGAYGYDQAAIPGQSFEGHHGFAKATVQPNSEQRLTVSASASAADVQIGDRPVPQSAVDGGGRWQWFLSPEVNLDTRVSAHTLQVGEDERQRLEARVIGSALSLGDPLGGSHDLKAGLDADRVAWQLESALPWDVDPVAEGVRLGGFAQDSYKPVSSVTLNVGARLDAALGRAHLGPRLYGAWDPFDDQKTKLALGVGRFYGQLGLLPLVVEPDAGLPRLDEAMALVERELVSDLALGVSGALRRRVGLITIDGGRADRDTRTASAFLRKIQTRRWSAGASWSMTQLVEQTGGGLVDTGGVERFAQSGHADFRWDLPTDPWTLSVTLWGALLSDPLGTVAVAPGAAGWAAAPRLSGGARVEQVLDVRKGRVALHLSVSHLDLLQQPTVLEGLPVVQSSSPELWGFEGTRLDGGVAYWF